MTQVHQLLTPIWDSETILREPVTMICGTNGQIQAPLLFTPEKVLSVTDLSGVHDYKAEKDWILAGRNLLLPPESSIQAITVQELFPPVHQPGKDYPVPGGFSWFAPNEELITRQLQVTYTCKKGQWDGPRPSSAQALLPRTFAALENKGTVRMVVNGDSISVGRQSSENLNLPPFQPGYAKLLAQGLAAHYQADIQLINTSVGGKGISWALENLEENVLSHGPELLIIAFGMNDGGLTPGQYGEKIHSMVHQVRQRFPLCEIILVATSLPNPVLTHEKAHFCGNQALFSEVLQAIAGDPDLGGGIAVADITAMHRYLLQRKQYQDLTSNNVNHPNDFLYRCYAQYLLGMLTP